jgi:rhodanese-related sulfurtransferase
MKIVDTKTLKELLAVDAVALFDVRGDVAYEYNHIPGAKTAPMGSLSFRVADVMKRDSSVAFYSCGNGCPMASEAAERLESLGFTNVFCYDAGIAGWREAGYHTVPSPHPKVEARGPSVDCRPLVVDTESAYGGAFKHTAGHSGEGGG